MDVHLSAHVLPTLRMHDFDDRRQQRRSDTPLFTVPACCLLPGPRPAPPVCLADVDCHSEGVSVAVQAERIMPFEDMPTLQVKQHPALHVSPRTCLFVLPLSISTPRSFSLFPAIPARQDEVCHSLRCCRRRRRRRQCCRPDRQHSARCALAIVYLVTSHSHSRLALYFLYCSLCLVVVCRIGIYCIFCIG